MRAWIRNNLRLTYSCQSHFVRSHLTVANGESGQALLVIHTNDFRNYASGRGIEITFQMFESTPVDVRYFLLYQIVQGAPFTF